MVLSLPMRNWNSVSLRTGAGRLLVLSLPMRNWNPKLLTWLKPGRDGSQPTYEELKPYMSPDTCHPPSRSQPTYEELKHYGEGEITERAPCSQPTYEELKQSKILFRHSLISVLSLPMRNWNGAVRPLSPAQSGVLSLPMRNWNKFLITISIAPCIKFSAYLWGIETTIEQQGCGDGAEVLSLPMRNWNYYNIHLNLKTWQFSAYLWGIETQILPNGIILEMVFSAYLWGIETWWRRGALQGASRVLSLPMRNWNPFYRHQQAITPVVLSLPMRNWN